MKVSLPQHAGQSPLSVTRARQAGHSGGSAVSSPSRKLARRPCARRARREGRTVAVVSIGGKANSSARPRESGAPVLYCLVGKRLDSRFRGNPRKTRRLSMSDPLVFDRALLRKRRERALRLGPETFLIDRVAADLGERLGAVLRQFDTAVDLGTPTDAVRSALAGNAAVGTLIGARGLPNADVVVDEEALPFRDGSLDLVVSALALQFVNDMPGTLIQIRRALKPDGLFLAALLGGETLAELRQAFAAAETEIEGGVSPRVAPFADLREMGALLQRAGFTLPVTDAERLTVRYSSPFILMSELRRMGVTNIMTERRRTPLRRATLKRMAEIYIHRFADPDGKIRATFELVWLSGWAPHESQQKPLRPGSARARLADALGVREIGTGEKPN